ncbi:MAG: ASCH domain-containing protein [Spirochaetales bacterium]|nr:ASCH domain-containing protein [Spirochaetales bacterium]
MTDREMWLRFTKTGRARTNEYESWSFGDAPDKLAALVLEGRKTATASAYDLYAYDNEDIPKVGDYSVILDSADQAVCIIVNTDVRVVPFRDVDESHARAEGEGDLSLALWREVHESFFRKELSDARMEFTEDSLIVLERFDVVFRP